MLTCHLLQLIEQSGRFGRILEGWLMLPDPLVAFRPEISFFDVTGLLGQRCFARGQVPACTTQCAGDPAQNQQIQQHENGAGNYPRKHALAWIHSPVPRRHHRGFPSRRNCAWSFGRMRGAAMSN